MLCTRSSRKETVLEGIFSGVRAFGDATMKRAGGEGDRLRPERAANEMKETTGAAPWRKQQSADPRCRC